MDTVSLDAKFTQLTDGTSHPDAGRAIALRSCVAIQVPRWESAPGLGTNSANGDRFLDTWLVVSGVKETLRIRSRRQPLSRDLKRLASNGLVGGAGLGR